VIQGADRRRLGLGLFAFGASGIVLILAALVLVIGSLSAVDDTRPTSRRQSYRTLVSRQVLTNNAGSVPYFFFVE